jgi:hypothetical protein
MRLCQCVLRVLCAVVTVLTRLLSVWQHAGNSLRVRVQFALQRGLMLELYSAGRCGDEGVLLVLGALLCRSGSILNPAALLCSRCMRVCCCAQGIDTGV